MAKWISNIFIAVFGIEIEYTIIATGVVVLIMSVCGGAWAVIASDFLQMLIVMIVTFVSTVVAVFKTGGIGVILEKGMLEHAIMETGINYTAIFMAWFVCVFVKQCFSTNNILDSYRYICAKDSINAKKVALLACVLMAIGPIIWFMPAWYMAAFHPDTTTWEVMNMGSRIKESVILVFMRKIMPVGMVGVMMLAMFAATMSSMDSALNKNAGIFVKNFYKKIINKNANEEKEMFISKVATIIFGLLVIAVTLFLNSLKNLSLFDIMMYVGTLVAFPLLIPSLLGFFIKKTPDWAAWAIVLVGLCVSYIVTVIITPTTIQEFLGLVVPFTRREADDLPVILGVIGHIFIAGGFFVCSQFFYKGLTSEREDEVADFFKRVDTPVITNEAASVEIDNGQRMILGKLLKIFGLSAILLCFVPNPLSGRLVFLSISIILYTVGYALIKSVKPIKKL